MLRCPHCGGSLTTVGATLKCARGHSFDVARQGYVALERKAARGDTAAMVEARARFLGAGHYAPIAAALVAAAGEPRTIVDVGAGPGYYLAQLLEARPQARGFALDSSRPALKRAVTAHPRITAVACDIWAALPLEDGAADLLVNVFAPRNPTEIRRVLAPGGALVVVTPTERHLRELDLLAVHPGKREQLHGAFGAPESSELVEFAMDLDEAAVEQLVAMGPSAHHDRKPGGAARVTASVVVETFRG